MKTELPNRFMSTTSLTLRANATPPATAKHVARKSGAEIETVVVPGTHPSLESQTVIDVLTAYKNVAEALQRVSGASISREFGAGERASIRGTAPRISGCLSAFIRQDSVSLI